MVRLRCPKCATIIQTQEGQTPECPTCGFGRRVAPPAQAAPSPAPPPPPPPSPAPPELAGWTSAVPPVATEARQATPRPPKKGAMAIVWTLVVIYLLVEGTLVSLATEPAEWRTDGSNEPFTVAILVLLAIDLALRIGIGVLVARDLKEVGAQRLKLAQVPATSLERTSPTGWGVTAGIFTLLIVILYAAYRRRIHALSAQAATAPQFTNRKELKAAHKTPGVFSPEDIKAVQRRSNAQTWLFLGLFIGMNVVFRVANAV